MQVIPEPGSTAAVTAVGTIGKIKAFDKRGHVSALGIVFVPLLVASLVEISRVSDYRHHWQDVFVGDSEVSLVGDYEMLEKSRGGVIPTNAERQCKCVMPQAVVCLEKIPVQLIDWNLAGCMSISN